MGECRRNSRRMTTVSEEAVENSSNDRHETASSSPAALPQAAEFSTSEESSSRFCSSSQPGEFVDLEVVVVTLNSGEEAGISPLEESSSRFCSSNDSGEFVDLEEARSFETDGSTSCIIYSNLSRERSTTGSSRLRSNRPDEEMESRPEGEEKRLANGQAEPPQSPLRRRVNIKKPPLVPMKKILRLSPAPMKRNLRLYPAQPLDFRACETERLKAFEKKYNFDFINEVPLEGRYDWVKLKPEQDGEIK